MSSKLNMYVVSRKGSRTSDHRNSFLSKNSLLIFISFHFHFLLPSIKKDKSSLERKQWVYKEKNIVSQVSEEIIQCQKNQDMPTQIRQSVITKLRRFEKRKSLILVQFRIIS